MPTSIGASRRGTALPVPTLWGHKPVCRARHSGRKAAAQALTAQRSLPGTLPGQRACRAGLGRCPALVVALHLEATPFKRPSHAVRTRIDTRESARGRFPDWAVALLSEGRREEPAMHNEFMLMIGAALRALLVLMRVARAEARPGIPRRGRCGGPMPETRPAVRGSVGIGYPRPSCGAGKRITSTERPVSALKLCHVVGTNDFRDRGRLRVSAGQRVARRIGRNVRFPRVPIPHPRT